MEVIPVTLKMFFVYPTTRISIIITNTYCYQDQIVAFRIMFVPPFNSVHLHDQPWGLNWKPTEKAAGWVGGVGAHHMVEYGSTQHKSVLHAGSVERIRDFLSSINNNNNACQDYCT